MPKPGSNYNEKHLALLEEIGEEKVMKLYEILDGEKLNLRPLVNLVKSKRVRTLLKTNLPIKDIASAIEVHPATVYRLAKIKVTGEDIL